MKHKEYAILLLMIMLVASSGSAFALNKDSVHRAGALSTIGEFGWAKNMGGTNSDEGYSIAVDPSGNVYTTGGFQGTADFDPGPGTQNLTALGTYDSFISKLDSNGNLIWARRIGGPASSSGGFGIAIDPNGSVYTTGSFLGTVDFNPGAGTFNLTSAGDWDVYISKLDASGNFVWAKSMGGIGHDASYGIAVALDGAVYTTGFFSDTVDLDPGVSMFNLTSNGGLDIFISKLTGNGDFVWAKQIGGTLEDQSRNIAVDANGNIFTTGSFSGPVDFDPNVGVHNLTNDGIANAFISKLDSNGAFIWAKNIEGTTVAGAAGGHDLTVDLDGNVYATGWFVGTVDFDPDAGTSYLTSLAMRDIFVLKLTENADFVWAKAISGTGVEEGYSIAVTPDGNVYTTGVFIGTVDFDPGAGTFSLTSVGDFDLFMSKLDASGNFVSAMSIGATGYDQGNAIALDSAGNVYTTGFFSGTVDFDPGPGSYNLTSAGDMDIFIFKLENSGSADFEDVQPGYWARSFIERLYSAGITGGCNVNPLRYCPDGTVTRAQMAVFLERGIHGSAYTPPAVGSSTGFSDVQPGYWAAAWIKQLAADGITGGCGFGKYCPDAAVTRAEMAVFLLRSKHGASYTPPGVGSGTGFTDVPPGYWAAAWIKQLVAEGITSGCGTGTYCPEAPVTRAQMAVFLVKAFNLP